MSNELAVHSASHSVVTFDHDQALLAAAREESASVHTALDEAARSSDAHAATLADSQAQISRLEDAIATMVAEHAMSAEEATRQSQERIDQVFTIL